MDIVKIIESKGFNNTISTIIKEFECKSINKDCSYILTLEEGNGENFAPVVSIKSVLFDAKPFTIVHRFKIKSENDLNILFDHLYDFDVNPLCNVK